MKRSIILFAACALFASSCAESMADLTQRVFSVAEQQYLQMDQRLAPGAIPKSYADGKCIDTDASWWCCGFPAGTMWYIYEYTRNDAMKEIAIKNTLKVEGIFNYPLHHDVGFMVNDSYGHAYRLTGDESYLPVIRRAAEALAGRFNPVVGCTMSWNPGRWQYPVIIDNMMNLELLTDASELFGEPDFKEVAMTHANTTMENHFRDDYTVYHLLGYDPESGEVLVKQTVQGFADESCWARGESWALYGYTMMYRETGEEKYLEQAEHIASYLFTVLPKDGIPYWDFNAPGTPNAMPLDSKGAPKNYAWKEGEPVKRDASAGTIMASAFAELAGLSKDPQAAASYKKMAEKMIRTLASKEYFSAPGENGNFLIKHCVGHIPGNSEIDVPLTYADYYFLEAVLRYNRL